MSSLKTKKTDASVLKFISSVKDKKRREDALIVLDIMTRATRSEPKMWGSAIIGFGEYKLKYPNGKEIDWPITAFSPRKQSLVLYGVPKSEKLYREPAKSKTGKGCIYINRIEDIDVKVLSQLIKESVKAKKSKESK